MTVESDSWIQVKPWLHLVEKNAWAPVRALAPLPGLTFTAWMDGRAMRDADEVFQQFWDEFKLPDYFGWNYPALNDCLRDLNWITADQYFLFIEEAQEVLAGDAEELREFLAILSGAGSRWSYSRHPDAMDRARFQVVLECGEGSLARMRAVAVEAADNP